MSEREVLVSLAGEFIGRGIGEGLMSGREGRFSRGREFGEMRSRLWRRDGRTLLVSAVCEENDGFAFLGVCCHTQGRLAQARLTLGYIPQPFQGWCVEVLFANAARGRTVKAGTQGLPPLLPSLHLP